MLHTEPHVHHIAQGYRELYKGVQTRHNRGEPDKAQDTAGLRSDSAERFSVSRQFIQGNMRQSTE